jgi:hypothetical protein
MSLDAEEQPLDVEVVNGEVVMTGPRVAVALGQRAATETARRLMAAAQEAGGGDCPVVPCPGAASNDI